MIKSKIEELEYNLKTLEKKIDLKKANNDQKDKIKSVEVKINKLTANQQEMQIKELEKAVEDTDFKKSGQDMTSRKCKKCELEVHSEGLLRRHNVRVHDAEESKQNNILGSQYDMQRYSEVLKNMGKGLQHIKSESCDYNTFSKGKLTINKLRNNQG